ncbi:MAG: LacI family DNA-binding transcriptional regulator [Cellulosilyticaceae bacterium]
MKITIKEIAQMTGVSVATVSRVVNNHPNGVGEAKRKEIQEVIEKYNYTPNLIAKSMITNKTQCIGLLIPDILNPFFQNLARGIEDCALQKGYSVFLCNTDQNYTKYLNYIRAMLSKNVDGLIVTGYPKEIEEELNNLLKNKKIVVIGREIQAENYCRITTDGIDESYEMTKYLIEMGHEKIACITGTTADDVNQERLAGYKRALDEYRIPFKQNLIFQGDFHYESGQEQGKLIIQNTEVTAIYCFNDMMAQGVYKACKELGKKIPEDISLVGFDDIYTAELMMPPLTTVRQPSYELGEISARALVDWMDTEKLKERQITLSNQLIIRESVKKI